MTSDLIILTQSDHPLPAPPRRIAALARFMGLQPAIVPVAALMEPGSPLSSGMPVAVSADALIAAERLAGAGTLDRMLFDTKRDVLVYGFCESARHNALVDALTGGAMTAVGSLSQGNRTYSIAPGATALTGAFAGLSFGPVWPSVDRVFLPASKAAPIDTHIAIAGHPLFASCRRRGATVYLTACAQVADIETPAVAPPSPRRLFSSLMPPLMFLRQACGERCHRPSQSWACLIVDDPILCPCYGFLDFNRLLRQMQDHHFATSVAVIPANHRCTRRATAQLFIENPEHLSISVHGNDHCRHEFAESDLGRLNHMIDGATRRMARHGARCGLTCDPVMVFPHGVFSAPAMHALKRHGYLGAVASVDAFTAAGHPSVRDAEPPLTIADFLSPVTTAFDGFPLYLRRYPHDIDEFAFDALLGKPLLIAAHHDTFRDGGAALVDFVDRLNACVPDLHWRGLADGMRDTCLYRRDGDNRLHLRALSRVTRLNGDLAVQPAAVTMVESPAIPVTRVTVDDRDMPYTVTDRLLTVALPGRPTGTVVLEVTHADATGLPMRRQPYRQAIAALIRRKLTAIRDVRLMRNRAFAWLPDLWQWFQRHGHKPTTKYG